MKTIHLFSLFAAPLLFTQCNEARKGVANVKEEVATAGDFGFAKNTFESLARGDSAVAGKIDWPVFTFLGENLGATYMALPTGVEKEKFINGYITQFATSFRESGGSVDSFTNWRVVTHDSQKTEVAADGTTGVVTILVSERDNMEKVSSINIVK
jgi:hypothetical protein